MMRIDIISAVPELLQSPLNVSIIKRAQDKKKVSIKIQNLRDYAFNKHKNELDLSQLVFFLRWCINCTKIS